MGALSKREKLIGILGFFCTNYYICFSPIFIGAVEGPSEFAEGLVIGVRSVFSGVVGGAAGTVSRITGALGKGIASLTFDSEFQRKRRDAIKKRGKQNFGESLARSSKGLAMGIFEGVTGVAMKPIGNNFLLKIMKKTNNLTAFSHIF